METEELFLTFACLLLFFDLIQLLKAKPDEKTKLEYGFYASIVASGLIAVSYFMLLQGFLKDDFMLKAVYSYSSTGLPISSKVYATWAGMSGSMLFSTFLLAIANFSYRFKTYERTSSSRLTVYRILNFILVFFIIVTLMNSPFERFQGTPMDGKGLNPLLQTFWMAIHPPIVFVGYVLIFFAFAFAMARMRTGESEERMFKSTLQAGWLFLTAGIAIGGVWAYEVLGWGGYWAWDPVETASLLPWLALTAYFHLTPLSKKSQNLTKEFMLLITFATVIFTTALTRGGLLTSVHAFGASSIGPILLLLALGVTVYFFYLARASKKPIFSMEVDRTSLHSLSSFTGYWSLVLIFLVCFWGIAFPLIAGIFLANPMSTSVDFYNNWNFPFAMAFVASLIGCSLYGKVGLKKFIGLIATSLGVGGILALVQWPTANFLANLGTPILVAALIAVGYRLLRVLPKKKRSIRLFGRSLLHCGIIITLLGVFASSAASQASGEILTTPSANVDTLGVHIELKNFTVIKGTGNVHSIQMGTCVPEYSALKLDVTIEYEGGSYETSLWTRYYTLYGIVSPTLIITTWTGDIYIRMLHTESMSQALSQALLNVEIQPDDLLLSVERKPLVYLVWSGVTLMCVGVAIPFARELIRSRPKELATE